MWNSVIQTPIRRSNASVKEMIEHHVLSQRQDQKEVAPQLTLENMISQRQRRSQGPEEVNEEVVAGMMTQMMMVVIKVLNLEEAVPREDLVAEK